ncbi:DUF7289 family protein [Halovivax limisalsi]|uniref:DUF7289 family protein n=1 Tax=Halovivax limisalsi TaxID=1453760 RepID=UPI001FFC4BE4|nr:hypothetical protein [Halovivax limisalsi]
MDPHTDRDSASNGTSVRGQSAVLGVVMLLGLVMITAIGLLLVGGSVVSETQSNAEKERIEQSFVELSNVMASSTVDAEMGREVDFDAGNSGAITKTEAGHVSISWGGREHINRTIGAIEYEHADGSIVAYQAGGVWAERGNETRMLSSPRIDYDFESETLTLPLTTVSEENELTNGPVSIRHAKTDPVPKANVVENETVELTVTSPYYRGWERFFRSQGGDGAVREVDHANQSVRVSFGQMELGDAIDRGATYTTEPGGNHPGEISENGQIGHLPPMDPLIEELLADARSGSLDVDRTYGDIDSDVTFTNGTYLADEIEGGSHTVDLGTGDVTILVDGDVASNGVTEFITVTNHSDDHQLKLYMTGDLDIQNGGNICVDPCADDVDASLIQVYGTSTSTVNINQGSPRYEGVIYVASDRDRWDYDNRKGRCKSEEYQVAFQADSDFTGSLIAATVCGQSSSYSFSHHDSLNDADIDPYPAGYSIPPRITYLNVALYELDVTNK